MLISKLKVENIRNLATVDIEPDPRLNIVHGANGAGKTSILESIVVLSRGRSFRTTQASELIGPEGDFFRVFAETCQMNAKTRRLGLERSGQHWRARSDGLELSQLSQLTRELPLVLMEPNSHLLVSGTPEVRRKYLDWGMFHVEREFLSVWRRFSKILKQRNAALRFQKEELLDSLDDVFVKAGIRLGELRKQHSEAVTAKVKELLKDLNPDLASLELNYSEGWQKNSLEEALLAGRQSDLSRGASGVGPHRADVSMVYKGSNAKGVLSRGEQKMLSSAMLLAQALVLGEFGEKPVLLMDDLASEFDADHFKIVLAKALDIGGQVWITGTENPVLKESRKVFHVEHGRVEEMV